jgi:hypothetical protein
VGKIVQICEGFSSREPEKVDVCAGADSRHIKVSDRLCLEYFLMTNLDLVNWTMEEARKLGPEHHMDSAIEGSPSLSNLLEVLGGERGEPSPEGIQSIIVGRPLISPSIEASELGATSDLPAHTPAPADRRADPIAPLLKAIVEPGIYTVPADRERAVALRWVLRDIKANRLKLSPIDQQDLRDLIDMGLVEMRNDAPVLTNAGVSAIV